MRTAPILSLTSVSFTQASRKSPRKNDGRQPYESIQGAQNSDIALERAPVIHCVNVPADQYRKLLVASLVPPFVRIEAPSHPTFHVILGLTARHDHKLGLHRLDRDLPC